MKMTTVISVFAVFLALVFSGCATPQAPSVQVMRVEDHNRKVVAPINTETMTEIVTAKLSGLAEAELRKVNSFLDYLWEVKADPSKQIMVMVVKQKMEFPPLLDEILSKHPKLNTLPRDTSTLVVVESARAPGVKNVFIKVPASLMDEKDDLFAWMPDTAEWAKFMNLRANKLEQKSSQEAFLILFAKANERMNPELIDPVEGKHLPPNQQWDWARMPHPKTLGNKCMYIPLATVQGPLTAFFK